MAEEKKSPYSLRSITTALGRIFSKDKPGEFSARNSVETALSATKRDIATRPIGEPTKISKKGFGVGSIFAEEGLGHNYHKYLERETLRHARYVMYDRMDTDLIASALDVYANEGTQKNQEGKVIGVYSSSKYIQEELRSMLEDTGMNNYMSWSIFRDMCKYGDHFVSLKLDSFKGVVGLTDMNPISIYRLEEEGDLVGFVQDLDVLKSAVQNANIVSATMNPYINLNTLSLPYMTGDNAQRDTDNSLITFLKYELIHFKLRGKGVFIPYGCSVLEGAVDVWKKLDLLFDSLIIYRLNRAPTRLVFYVDVGNNQGADVENVVKRQINALTKKEYFGPTGKLNERYQLLDMNANLFIPVQKGSSSKIEKLEGSSDVGQIEDVAFLNNRLFASLKVPKSFLGYEGDVSSKGMLSQQNVTFARAIQNIQEDFLESIKDMCIIHLAIRGISDVAQLRSFDLIMTRPSYVEEKARIEVDGALLELGEKYKSIGANRKWIAKHVLHRTDIEIEEMFKIDPAEQQAAQAMAGGAPMAGGGGMPMDMGLGANMEAPTGQELPQEGMPQEAAGQVPMGGAPVAPAAGMVTQGNMPLTQEYRREGNLLVENFNTTSTVKNYNKEIKKLISLIECNGFLSVYSKQQEIKIITETNKAALTEPEDVFE